jgi:cytochrome c nitrite reductase small subunit
MKISGKVIKLLVVAGGAGIALLLFLALGPPKLLARSSSPEFCSGCHTMESNYEAWSHAGAHRRGTCVDCHLPNENRGAHALWKTISGLKDAAMFYSGRVPDHIKITAHGKEVLQANCIRCHETTVMFINHERRCWECHRRISHKRTGAMATL